MSFFGHLHKSGAPAIKPQGSQIRKEVIRVAPDVRSHQRIASPPAGHPSGKSARQPNGAPQKTKAGVKHGLDESPNTKLNNKKPRHRPSPRSQPLQASSDSSDDDSFLARSSPKPRVTRSPDLKRQVRCRAAFVDEDGTFPMVHAADIASIDKTNKYKPAFVDTAAGSTDVLLLQYPSASQPERYGVPRSTRRRLVLSDVPLRYELVVPREHDEFKPLDELIQVVDLIAQNYLASTELDQFTNDNDGIVRRLKRAIVRQSELEFRSVISEYNDIITTRRTDGSISARLDAMSSLELPLIERLLLQIYSRTVSPRVGSLRQYENGTDNVYGELLPRFLSQIFRDTKLKSDQIFVDLGSGVGNAVLQAALEIGCESWGCEVMENACDLAELQEKEFIARCRLWGLQAGSIHLERGDFLKNAAIGKIIKRADVVLVNNQAFTPQLNNGLINLFLDLREGCQIVSLKSFVPHGHKITTRNLNSPVNLLEVEQKQYWSDSVSWTDAGGTYFVARKDSTKLRAFAEKNGIA